MDKEKSPTYNRVGYALSSVVEVVEREMENSPNGIFSFGQMEMILRILPSLLEDPAEAGEVRERFSDGVEMLEGVADEFPEISEELAAGVQVLVMGMFHLVTELADKKMEQEVSRIAPLMKVNKEKEALVETARSLAEEMWDADKEEKIRISEMAVNVYDAMLDQGFIDALPENKSTLKDWIKDVAPKYARMGGKPRKDPKKTP